MTTYLNTVQHFGVRSDLRVVGTNPEMADMSNPRGEIVAEVFYVTACDADGNRLAHFYESRDQAKIEALRDRIAAADWLNPNYWSTIEPVYGSRAYIEGGWERHNAELEAQGKI